MLLKASDPYTLHNPSKCELRVYLRHHGEPEEPPGPYEEVLRVLGKRHEKSHLGSFATVVDLSSASPAEREERTREEVRKEAPVIYQAGLKATTRFGGVDCEVVGEPDFLIYNGGNYVIRDSKMSRRITQKDHPEIFGQLQIYGWLFEQTFSKPPLRLEIHGGAGAIVEIPYDGTREALQNLEEKIGRAHV